MNRLLCNAFFLLFPNHCIGCHQWLNGSGSEICVDCLDNLNFLTAPAHLPKIKTRYFNQAHSLLAYEGPVLEWVHRFKYGRQFYVGRVLGEKMGEMQLHWKTYDAILPVPLHWSRQAQRGFNPPHLLAHMIAKRHAVPLLPYLKRSRATPPQTGQTGEERLQNVHNAFASVGTFKKGRLLLIDDVLTTGSTVNEAARALKKAGALSVDVLTLARTI